MAYYANEILNIIDPGNELICYRLFNEHCYRTASGHFIKDLRIIKNRDLGNMVIVDNAAYSYAMQTDNGVPIIPFFNDKSDSELSDLVVYLTELSKSKDVRDEISQFFYSKLFWDNCQDPAVLKEKIVQARSALR
jgi:CTD small phosphatase-like protein 2